MSTPDDNPFKPADPPQFAPVEVVAEVRRKLDQPAAAALARSWPYAGMAGFVLAAIAIAVCYAVYTQVPLRHALLRIGSTALFAGVLGVPAAAMLLFAASAWGLRRSPDQEQFVLAVSRQRRAIVAAGVAAIVSLAVMFFLLMMQFHVFIDTWM